MSGPASPAASLNIGLLNRLRAAAGDYVPIDELARGLAVGNPGGGPSPAEPAVVLAELDALASFGFGIERHPSRGAAYVGPADRLCPDQIEHELGTRRIGRRIAVWDRVSSTNDLAAGACRSASNDGLVVLADEQTAGRGRLGRSWTAPPRSSILMSVVLFPPRDLDPHGPEAGPGAAWLTAMGAVATAEVVSTWIGRPAAIKWPNDVRVDGRKIAGILAERPAAHGQAVSPGPPEGTGRAAVIGIGLNVNPDAGSLPADLRTRATSIRIECGGRPADRSEVARDLIRRLDHWYTSARSLGPAALNTPWRDRSEHLGRLVRVDTPAGPRSGRLVDLDLHRGLTLETVSGGVGGRIRGVHRPESPLILLATAEVLAIEEIPVGDSA